jgi:hypothetical protein
VLRRSRYADRVVDVGVDGPRSLARSNFELKIINLFDSSSFVYFKKPCSTGFWEILFSRTQNPEPKKSRTEKIMTKEEGKIIKKQQWNE